MVLLIFNKTSYNECILPNLRNSDYYMPVYIYTGQKKELLYFRLDVTNGKWTIYGNNYVEMSVGGIKVRNHSLLPDDEIDICILGKTSLKLLVIDRPPRLCVPDKILLEQNRRITVGQAVENDIKYEFSSYVERQQAILDYRSDGLYVDNCSLNGTYVNGRGVEGRIRLNPGDRIQIFGLNIIYLNRLIVVYSTVSESHILGKELSIYHPAFPAHLRERQKASEEFFNRSPRELQNIITDTIEIEGPPSRIEKKEQPILLTIGPAFTMAIPMLLGSLAVMYAMHSTKHDVTGFMYAGLIIAVSSAIIGTVWAVLNVFYSRQEQEDEEEFRFREYAEYLSGIVKRLHHSYEHNRIALKNTYSSAEQCVRYNQNDTNLWKRNYTHEDLLFVRLGTGKIPFQVSVKIPRETFDLNRDYLFDKPQKIQQQYTELKGVPVGISLKKYRLIGLIGGRGNSKRRCLDLMNIISVQLASNLCYTDLKMAYIYDRNSGDRDKDWDFYRWYPHVWSEDRSIRFVAGNVAERRDVFFELTDIIRKRLQNSEKAAERNNTILPHYVLFISNPDLLRGEPLTNYLYRGGTQSGFTAFLMTETVDQLPNACEYVIQYDQNFCGFYSLVERPEERMLVRFDKVSRDLVEAQARQLSSVKVKEQEMSRTIPASISFLGMYGVDCPEELQVLERWTGNRTYESLGVPIGRKNGDLNIYLDIHEKFHGPHGLVAGTTGSGKSEMLQTFILSLAVNFSPEDLAFLLIDFKGGGMANLFAALPHLAGQVTNLSGNEIQRAMISITSENERRERIFSEYGVNHIDEYTMLYKNGEATVPIPHLLIIIDEFAELKKTNAGFMRELISVAQVGRSLGVHLILATQKPSGIVDDSIMSNSRFRICLRVQERQDSLDMLHRPDAAFITHAGRGFFQVGTDEVFELFQSAYSGERFNRENLHRQENIEMITLTGKKVIVGSGTVRRNENFENGIQRNSKETRQLDAIVAYIEAVAANVGYKKNRQLWLPPLPEKLYLDELVEYNDVSVESDNQCKEYSLKTVIGLYDDPVNQRQMPYTLDFARGGNHVVFGAGSTGKSTLLLTAAYSLLMHHDSSEVNIYVIDFSSHLLSALESSDAVGAVVFDSDMERTDRFIGMLNKMHAERKELLSGGGFVDYCRQSQNKLPAIIVMIDNIGAAYSKLNDNQKGDLVRIIREGNTCGIYFMVSASGISINDMPQSLVDHFKTTLSLEQSDKYKYMETLRIQSLPIRPEHGVRGRGLAVIDGRVLEFQTALPLEAESEYDRGDAIRRKLLLRNNDYWGSPADTVPELPKSPSYSDLTSSRDFSKMIKLKEMLPAGWKTADASLYMILLRDTYCYTVSGSARSGKTTFMKTVMLTILQKGAQIIIVEPAGDSLEMFSVQHDIGYYKGKDGMFAFCQMMVPVFKEKNRIKKEMLKKDVPNHTVFDEINKSQIFVFITDLFEFVRTAELSANVTGSMSGFLENIFTKGNMHGIYFIAELRTEDAAGGNAFKLFRIFTEYRQGIHLGGKISSLRFYDFSGVRMTEQMSSMKRGTGLVRDPDDETKAVRVVVPDLER